MSSLPLAPAATETPSTHAFDVTLANFEQDVVQRSLQTPILLDFWAEWCGPCKQLGPILEKLAADYNGAFLLAKVNIDEEQQLAAEFGIRSVPTVILVKDGQLLDGFPGALPEGQLRQFLSKHGIEPAPADTNEAAPPASPEEVIAGLRARLEETPDADELKLDLALALARHGETAEARGLIDALPANLGTDERARNALVLIRNAEHLADAPSRAALEARIASDPNDLAARHLLGLRLLGDGEAEAGLQQFLAMLDQDKDFEGGLPRKALIAAFDVLTDAELVSRYRREMAARLF